MYTDILNKDVTSSKEIEQIIFEAANEWARSITAAILEEIDEKLLKSR